MIAKVGHYRVIDLIAAGGMGVVYRAEDVRLNRQVALKFLSRETAADEEYRARFLREARIAAALNHPNTCTVYEVGEVRADADSVIGDFAVTPGTPFIAMEFIDGHTLSAWLEREAPLDALALVDIAIQIADGLAEAHARHIVHRDLKPQNIMITSTGTVKLVDFGLAKPLTLSRNAAAVVSTSEMISADLGAKTVIGTCAYMSPEQASGKSLDSRSDVFTFGIILYQMVAGQLPFRGDTATEILAKILEADPQPLPATAVKVPPALTRTISRCLRKKPEERPADARELAVELQRLRRRLAKHAALRHAWQQATRRIGLKPSLAPWQLVIVLSLVATGWLSYELLRPPHPERVDSSRSNPSPPSPKLADSRPTESTVAKASDGAGVAPAPQTESAPEARHTKPAAPTRADKSSAPAPSQTNATPDRPKTGVTSSAVEPASDEGAQRGTAHRGAGEVDDPNGRGAPKTIGVVAPVTNGAPLPGVSVGQLTVISDIWVNVSLDDGAIEQTPIHFSDLPVGPHRLRASRAGYVTKQVEIFIETGKSAVVRIELERQ